ncbi:phospho-N-acetylmuramoyl-pentapeptide-transferase [Blochmannia endosymbiont of Polyrhachis (Hedomyrma) turneri]|uniref:phospho-N-acetylmuramoyl-pentapeptide- transferase n=1 Tax=Blochmannia endosymbiont of Polyrhachis (Hedomyrma) turneri TaxID=1505596 RepID=UPI00061A74EC|nr:phospho-N-acetylmuramoyl-pentapeptide-transferase [Blochmannia endosymbiont of Polyrhachis (Hedomyrma) turneri]AKC59722.1 phospho-N-acetylmuramoyl-pentapeptide-transferase [Blochmannia endosymbiont of Polyrhachis (Hedomyrma) turneri]
MVLELVEYCFKFYSNNSGVFSHVTFRSFFSLLSAWLISLWIGPYLITLLKKLKINQVIRTNGPSSHSLKQGTPTMGGVMILFSIILSILLWSNLCNHYIWYVICILVFYGCVGFLDDYYKILKKNSCGLSALSKYCLLSIIALLLMSIVFMLEKNMISTRLTVPFFSNVIIELGVWYIIFGYLVVVGTSNAVNLSDGLDGLVIFPIVCIAIGLGIIALVSSNIYFANYFSVQYCVFVRELVVVCSSIIGAGLGFLWFNAYPARIFMGDVGSLSLGGAIGVIAVLLHQEIVLCIMGGVFVLETFSVIIQVCFFKFYGYRIFQMAPIHHHFELQGSPEPRIVVRFWIVNCVLVLIGLIVLKVC